jgi:hypothetical protein
MILTFGRPGIATKCINCEFCGGDWAYRQISPELPVLPWIRGARSWSQIIQMPLLWEGAGLPTHGDGYMAMEYLLLSVVYQSMAPVQCVIQTRAEHVLDDVFAFCAGVTQKYLVAHSTGTELRQRTIEAEQVYNYHLQFTTRSSNIRLP